MQPYKILFKYPSRERCEKFFAGLDNIINNLADKDNYSIVVTLDKDDETMCNKDVLKRLMPYIENHKVIPIFGTSENKVHAINRDLEQFTDFDIIICYSDDMEFQVYGFDNIIREKFALHFPDTNGNLHFYDGFQNRVSTMTIMGRAYFESKYQNRKIYNPIYKSLYVDEEYTKIANKLIKMQYLPQVIFIHKHPANGHGVADALLQRTESYNDVDKFTFLEREKNNFGLFL